MSDQEPEVVYEDRNAREKIELVVFWLAIGVQIYLFFHMIPVPIIPGPPSRRIKKFNSLD